MQFCQRIAVQYRKGESIRCNDALVRHFAKYAIRLTRIDALSDYSEVLVISRAFVGVALETEGLEIRQVILTAMFARHDVVHLYGPLLRRDAAEFAAKTSTLQETSSEIAEGGSPMIVDRRTAFLKVHPDGVAA